MAEDRTTVLLRALMRPGGNPYAYVSNEAGEVLTKAKNRAAERGCSQHDLAAQQGDLFESSSASPDMAKHPSGNPYASLANLQDEELPASANVESSPEPALAVTKAVFRGECTRVFRLYIPAAERGRLREYMRAFINRNESRSAKARALLLRELARFDFSDLGAIPQFNREDESLSEQKLREVERSVGPGE